MNVVRWGLVGAGDIAEKRVAPALVAAKGSELVAVSRRQAELAEASARRFGARRWHADWHDLIRDDEIDAVYVAAPVKLHAPITIAACEAGKHVLCEKPMALSVEECDRMIRCAEASGVMLGIAYYRHLYPIVQRVKQLLAEGAIGAPVLAQLDAFERFDPPPGHPRAWLLDPAVSGGGPMFDFGCHRIEVLLSLFGDAADVRALRGNVLFDRPVEDTAVATMRFPRGPLATVTVSHAAAEPRDTLDLFGSEGSIHIAKLNGSELRLVRRGEQTVEQHPAGENAHLPLIQQFVEAVLSGGRPVVDGAAGRAVNRVLEAVYR
jgi:1,5-anhydro-D-fructose reductase (1,5-anhydro-D-mannitol-forming)